MNTIFVAGAGFEPDEGQARIGFFQRGAIVADLDHEQAFRVQMGGSLRQHAAHQRQAVAPAGERDARLAPVFARQRTHRRGVDIGRVGQDQVIAAREPGDRTGRIGPAVCASQGVVLDVAARHLQRFVQRGRPRLCAHSERRTLQARQDNLSRCTGRARCARAAHRRSRAQDRRAPARR